MKAAKLAAILCLAYLGIVVAFEGIVVGLILDSTSVPNSVVLTTTTEDGTTKDTILVRMESNGQLFVSANHWPRAWYNRALKNPNVQVRMDGEKADYLAVLATTEERDRLFALTSVPFAIARVLTGFAPRGLLRLDPR